MKTNEEIIKFVDDTIIEVIDTIETRAKEKALDVSIIGNELFNVDNSPYADPEDDENHKYDLGKLDGLKEVKCFIENKFMSFEQLVDSYL